MAVQPQVQDTNNAVKFENIIYMSWSPLKNLYVFFFKILFNRTKNEAPNTDMSEVKIKTTSHSATGCFGMLSATLSVVGVNGEWYVSFTTRKR